MPKLTEAQLNDLHALNEIIDGIGLGEALQDGAYGFDFENPELQEAFDTASKAAKYIQGYYELLQVANEMD